MARDTPWLPNPAVLPGLHHTTRYTYTHVSPLTPNLLILNQFRYIWRLCREWLLTTYFPSYTATGPLVPQPTLSEDGPCLMTPSPLWISTNIS